MHTAIDRPTMSRDQLRDLTCQIEALTMVWIDPGIEDTPLAAYGLSAKEGKIALYLKERFGRTVSRESLSNLLYSERPDPPDIKIIDVFICHIRQKLIDSPYGINVEWGQGYRMVSHQNRKFTPGVLSNHQFVEWRGLTVTNAVGNCLTALEQLGGRANLRDWAAKAKRHPVSIGRLIRLAQRVLNGSGYDIAKVEIPRPTGAQGFRCLFEYQLVSQNAA